jgi:hypothetical protein
MDEIAVIGAGLIAGGRSRASGTPGATAARWHWARGSASLQQTLEVRKRRPMDNMGNMEHAP